MPSWELFEDQRPEYREDVLPADVPKISVEAATTFGWSRWVDASIGIDTFGASGKGDKVLEHFGISPGSVAERVQEHDRRSRAALVRVRVGFTPVDEVTAPLGIVIDVLRATSTICQALASGYERVVCVGEIDDARALAGPGVALAGERGNFRIDGFDFGNSPREFAGRSRRGGRRSC